MMKKCLAIVSAALICGCVFINPSIRDSRPPLKSQNRPDVSRELAEAAALRARAVDEISVAAMLAAYEKILEQSPGNYDALVNAANALIIYEIGYRMGEAGPRKEQNYLKAMRYTVEAMRTNPEFERRFKLGVPPWSAARHLSERELDAVFLFLEAHFDFCVECYNPKNFSMMLGSGGFSAPSALRESLLAIKTSDPETLSLVYYYCGVTRIYPAFMGGDLSEAERFFNLSLATGKNPWAGHFGLGYFVSARKGDRRMCDENLQKMLTEDLPPGHIHYPWMPPLHRMASQFLESAEREFPPQIPKAFMPRP